MNLRPQLKERQISVVFVLIPLVLSAYTHLWNPTGYPSIHVDEGHYLRKAISTETGQGLQPQDRYRAPYFGQIFLAGIFSIIGYPNLDTLGDKNPVEHLYLVPRVIMGILAVFDTFLLYRITEYRYGRNVALIASILFAVMPFTWMTRRIFLESIQLPFILTSILLILNLTRGSQLQSQQLGRKQEQQLSGHQDQQQLQQKQQQPYYSEYTKFTLIISGIFLGLAIFTKIPSKPWSLNDLLFGDGVVSGGRKGAAKDGSDLIDDGAEMVVDGCDGGEVWFRGWDVARQDLNPDGEETRRQRMRVDGNTLDLIGIVHGDDGEP